MAYDWKRDLPRLEAKYNIPPGLLGALVRGESGGRADATSPVGAYGLTQLMPATAKGLGVNPRDPAQNLEGGAKYLSQQLKAFRGNIPKALAAYNAGPGAVKKYGGVPPYKETQEYVKRLTGYWKESSRYGTTNQTRPTQQNGSQAPQKPIPGQVKPITPVKVPDALAEPTRQEVVGLDEKSVAQANQVYSRDPAMAQAIINRRQREQNQHDVKYANDFTAFQANRQAIQSAQDVNKGQLLGANKYPTRITAGTQTNLRPSITGGVYNSKAKFIKAPGGWVKNVSDGEQSYKFLQRLGRGFGLNPGDTTRPAGTRTASGGISNHSYGRAVDFGDATNSREKLMTFAKWARQNAGSIRELYYTPLGYSIINGKVQDGKTIGGHNDHLHIAW